MEVVKLLGKFCREVVKNINSKDRKSYAPITHLSCICPKGKHCASKMSRCKLLVPKNKGLSNSLSHLK